MPPTDSGPLPEDPRLWPADFREEWAERAAIIEYDGAGCSRGAAEALAARIVRRRVEAEATRKRGLQVPE